MSNDVLTFAVEAGVQGNINYRSRPIKFGDGYEVEVGDGLNAREETWPVTASGPLTELQPLITFLDLHPAYVTFLWAPPHLPQARYKCKGYAVANKHGDEVSVSATFMRAYQP